MIDIISERSDEQLLQIQREGEYRRKIEETFFEYGRLKSIPAQRKKKRIILEKIAENFLPGCVYEENEVNDTIQQYHEDYCTLRRDMISEGIARRDGTQYTFWS